MYINNKLLIGKNNDKEVCLLPSMANRHGLITGASGTGKTITSKVMAESFSDLGVPVFMADVKGDLAGTAVTGEMNDNIAKRVSNLKLDNFEVKEFPVRFWDVYRLNGHPIRFKVSDVGVNVLSIMLGLSEAQEGVLNIVFKVSEDKNWDLDTLDDLKQALNRVGEIRNELTTTYGNVTTQSVGVILRSLSVLENQGLSKFFGEPELNIHDLVSIDNNGKGIINILDAVELYKNPDLYSAVMLCLLTRLYDSMPEVGDLDIPKIVFFFDEAYFLFREMPPYRLKQVEKIVRLIRSKGIGLYFISHYTTDIPANILDQLGNRVQHNLRAYTPADQKIAKAAADSFRTNPKFKTYDTILELGTGEAIVSFQNEKGEPEVCERVFILPPQSKIGVIDDMTRNRIINQSPLAGKYDEDINDRSASEIINETREKENIEKEEINKEKEEAKRLKEEEKAKALQEKEKNRQEREKKNTPQYKLGKKVVNKTTDKLLNRIINKVLKSLFK
jgi:DNA helicase HerA-like ATPase